MARFAYDVNTTQRYIDVHKQFQGGLKTVDTDDALGAVFLREAENVSISEFGFLEKRYGTFENFKENTPAAVAPKLLPNLQGYWEFEGYKIFAVDGDLFVDNFDNRVVDFLREEGLRYPLDSDIIENTTPIMTETNVCSFENVGEPFSSSTDQTTNPTCGVGVERTVCFGGFEDNFFCQTQVGTTVTISTQTGVTVEDHFQRDRDMNAVNINRVLYIFTGTYPVYAKVEEGQLNFYLFPITIPNFDEIVVTGHNLLENNYEDLYFEDNKTLNNTGVSTGTFIDNFFIKESSFYPAFPFADNDGKLNVKFSYQHDVRLLLNQFPYHELIVDNVSFAPAGSTASDIFTPVDPRFIKSTILNTNSGAVLKVLTENDAPVSNFVKYSTSFSATVTFTAGIRYRLRLFNNSASVNYGSSLINFEANFGQLSTGAILPSRLLTEVVGDFGFIELNPAFFNTGELVNFEIFLGNFNSALAYNSVEFQEMYEVKTRESFIGNSLLNMEISNLLAGNWDFRFNVKLRRIEQSSVRVLKELPFIIQNITITPERLEDFPRADANSPGIDYPTLKPIWTCNKVLEHFGKLMVWGSTAMPTAVFYSFPDRPSYFPSKFFLDFTNDQNSPVEAVSSYMNILVVQTRDQTWGIRGNSGLLTAPAPYAPFTINPTVGTIAYKSVRAVRNQLFFLSKQGIIALKSLFATDEQYNIEFVDRNILNIVPRDDDKAVGIQFDNQYWLNFPQQRITLRWYIDKKAWVQDKYTAWQEFNGVFKYQIVNGKLEFITYPSLFDGENLGVYKIGVDYSLPTDLGEDVVALFETAFLNQNYPFHPKNYKETKMDFTVQNEYNLGRDPIYTMETNEDIDNNLHTIQSPALFKNHRYKLTYSENFAVTSVKLHETPLDFVKVEGVITFLLPNDAPVGSDLTVQGSFENYEGGASLLDITYDHILDFKTWIISEDKTLNLENFQGYDQSKADIPIELGARFGDWVFGLSDLGNKVTAIKTIKLAGRGYNVKVYFEDYSKSKWTLESLGITYKMKRPRSR